MSKHPFPDMQMVISMDGARYGETLVHLRGTLLEEVRRLKAENVDLRRANQTAREERRQLLARGRKKLAPQR